MLSNDQHDNSGTVNKVCCFSLKGLNGKIPLKNCKETVWPKFKCFQGKHFLKIKVSAWGCAVFPKATMLLHHFELIKYIIVWDSALTPQNKIQRPFVSEVKLLLLKTGCLVWLIWHDSIPFYRTETFCLFEIVWIIW